MNQPNLQRPTLLIALGLAFALLSGCVRFTGIDRQGKTLPDQHIAEDASFTQWPATRWWQAYASPELDRLIERGLADNPSVESALARLRGAQAGSAYAAARRQPQLDLGIKSTVQRFTENGLFPPEVAGDHRADNRFALDLKYELDLFGKNRAIRDSVQAQAAAVGIDVDTARLGVASAIAHAWFGLAQATAERAVVAATLAQRRKILALVLARVSEGLDSKVEQRQAEGAIPQAAEELAAVDERINLLRDALAQLAVVPATETAKLAPLLNPLALPALPAGVPSDLLARRPDVAAARLRVESLLKGVESVKAEFYPSVDIVAFAGFSAIGLDNLLQGGSQIYGFGPTLHLPIFDAGRLRAKLKFVNAQLDMSIADYNAVLLGALHEVVRSVVSLRALGDRATAQRDALAAAESAYEVALQRFKAGLTGYLTVLATESEVLRERRAGVLLTARAYALDIDLKRALGGGFETPRASPPREQE